MKRIILLLLLIINTNFLYSQWFIQNYAVEPIHFYSSPGGKLFLTYNGIIYNSTNLGTSWKTLRINDLQILSSYFLDSLNAITVTKFSTGYNYLYKTSNGGLNWYGTHLLNTDEIYSNLFFTNLNIGWAINNYANIDGHVILKTTNGGSSWIKQYKSNSFISSIYMFNSDTGFALTSDSVLSTINGGVNWSRKYIGPYNNNKICFVNNSTGFIICHYNVAMYKTTDMGANWTRILNTPETSDIEGITFINENTGWLGYGGGGIYKTTNCGANWVLQRGFQGYSPANDVTHLFFLNNFTGFAGVYNGTILKTTNSGTNWIENVKPVDDAFNDVSFLNNNTGFMVSHSGFIYRTTNKGANWNVGFQAGPEINSVFTDSVAGCHFVCNSGKYIRSFNSGNTWDSMTVVSSTHLNNIIFTDSITGYICGNYGLILKTTNKGNNWVIQASNTAASLTSLYFINKDVGWICGVDGKILKTTNSGENWINIYTFLEENYDICFLNSQKGFVINYKNTGYPSYYHYSRIYKTENGGNNWSLIYDYINTRPQMTSIKFINENTGYITASNGDLLKTVNGGLSFDISSNYFSTSLNSLGSNNSSSVWIVGNRGLVMSTENVNVGMKYSNIIIPDKFIMQGYPNPFNPVTKIKFEVPKTAKLKIIIYDITGRVLETLADKLYYAGFYEVEWNAAINSSGIYFCKMISGEYSETIKLILVK